MSPVLGYWMIRGLAEPIRYLLWYTGTEYEEKLYEVTGEPGNWSREQWTNVKETLGLEFPNLPYYIDGDTKITETQAILEHLARKHHLAGSNEEDYVWLSMTYGVIMDAYKPFAMMCYQPDYETLKVPYLEKLPTIVARLQKCLRETIFWGNSYPTWTSCCLKPWSFGWSSVPRPFKVSPAYRTSASGWRPYPPWWRTGRPPLVSRSRPGSTTKWPFSASKKMAALSQ